MKTWWKEPPNLIAKLQRWELLALTYARASPAERVTYTNAKTRNSMVLKIDQCPYKKRPQEAHADSTM